MHGSSGTFDIDLLAAPPQTECRSGGAGENYQVIVTFARSVTVGAFWVASGDGRATATATVAGAVVTVDLAQVANLQMAMITLVNVNDGVSAGDVAIPFRVLFGDTNGDRVVNSGDVLQTRNRAGGPAGSTNFRSDVNTDGAVNSGDTLVVRSRAGTSLP